MCQRTDGKRRLGCHQKQQQTKRVSPNFETFNFVIVVKYSCTSGSETKHLIVDTSSLRELFRFLNRTIYPREIAKYTMWMVEAQASGIGLHNEEGKSAAVRNVNWVIEDPRMLFDELKGKPLKGSSFLFWEFQIFTSQLSTLLS